MNSIGITTLRAARFVIRIARPCVSSEMNVIIIVAPGSNQQSRRSNAEFFSHATTGRGLRAARSCLLPPDALADRRGFADLSRARSLLLYERPPAG